MVNGEKTHQWTLCEHDYVVCEMVKTAQVGGLNIKSVHGF